MFTHDVPQIRMRVSTWGNRYPPIESAVLHWVRKHMGSIDGISEAPLIACGLRQASSYAPPDQLCTPTCTSTRRMTCHERLQGW